jgi:acyl-coenzyme A thioesterase 9
MEDLDWIAGLVANRHVAPKDGKEGTYVFPALVTASVDRIIMLRPVSELVDYEISGMTTWVGRSSMEISLDLVTLPERNPVMKANFTFVARDPATKRFDPLTAVTDDVRAMPINPLIVETPEEKIIFSRAEGQQLKS